MAGDSPGTMHPSLMRRSSMPRCEVPAVGADPRYTVRATRRHAEYLPRLLTFWSIWWGKASGPSTSFSITGVQLSGR